MIIRSSIKARQEGKRLLEQFRLVTDNPTVILHQEEAKELLNVQSPEKLFQFVQEATSLKPCKDLLEKAECEINAAKERLGTRKENLRGLKATMNVKEEELKTINRKFEKSENENTLGRELISVLLNDSRKARKKIEESLHDLRKLKDEHEVQIESLDKERNNLEVQIGGMTAKLKKENDKVKQDLSDLKNENKRLIDEKKYDEKCIKETDSHIKRIKEELKIQEEIRQDAEKKKTLLKDISVKRDEENGIKLKITKFEDEKIISEKTLEVNDQRIKAAKYNKTNCQTKLDGLRRELKQMEATASYSLANIDALAPQVVKEIEKVGLRFVKKPVGPVGSLISLSNEAQSDRNLVRLIESEIGVKLLKSYVVNDDADRRLLKKIFDQVYGRSERQPVIFQSKFLKERHNVVKVEHQKTILDYIKFSGSEQESIVVFNHLVDQKFIESIVITEKQSEAKKLCTYRHRVPANLKHVITLDGYKFIPPSDRSFYRSYYLELQPARVLDRKINRQIYEQKIAITKAEGESKRLKEEINIIQSSSSEEKGKLEEALKVIITLTKQHSKITIELNQLIEEEKNAERPEDLQKKKNDLVSLKNSLGLSKEKLKNTNLNINTNKANMKSVQIESLKVRDVSMQLETEVRNNESLVISNRKDVCNKMKVVNRCQDEISQLEANLKKETRRMEERERKALNMNVDPDSAAVSSRTAEQVSACIGQVRKTTDGFESSVARKQQLEIFKTLNILKESARCEKEKINEIAKFVRNLEEMNVDRKERYFLIRDLIKNQIERTFSVLIQDLSREINMRILLKINYKNREVNFEEDGENYSQLDLSCLSGGEKTFLQVVYDTSKSSDSIKFFLDVPDFCSVEALQPSLQSAG